MAASVFDNQLISAGQMTHLSPSFNEIEEFNGDDGNGNAPDGKTSSLKDIFNTLMLHILQTTVVLENEEDYLGKKLEKFVPLLRYLLKHPQCHDFYNWENEEHGETILHTATRIGHKQLIEYICKNSSGGTKGLVTKSENGLACLHIAAQRAADPALVKLLLDHIDSSTAAIPGSGGNTPLHLAVDYRKCGQFRRPIVVKLLLEASMDALMYKNEQMLTPLQYHYFTKKEAGESTEKEEVATEIEALLKLNCLRLDVDRDEMRELLYSNPADRRELTFDLVGYEEIRADDLKKLSSHISFDTILKSVVIPDLVVRPEEEYLAARQDASRRANASGAASKEVDEVDNTTVCDRLPDCPGRIDYCWIFKWLRSQGVDRIMRISIEDQRHTSHSDEAIEWCLQHTRVESLDWNKLDICATTIHNAASHVRNLTLWCSGNNAVLKSWISPGDGLVELSYLKSLKLKILQGLESLSRMTTQAKDFESKFLEARKVWCMMSHGDSSRATTNTDICAEHKVEVQWDIMGSDGKSVKTRVESEDEKQAETEKQEWIHCMEKFADFVRGYREDVEESEADSSKLPRRIKVALIDDGVDGLNADLSCVIEMGQTFSERSRHSYNSYFSSTNGHGTIMAMLIRKICPNVRLYVAKLNEQKTGRNKMSITAESAVKAIRWAISNDVDIISMSWTIDNINDTATVQNLTTAINEAVERGILIFCSASDQGPNDTALYPADCNRDNSFLIGTATASGQAWKWNGASHVDYILPGKDLDVQIGDDLFDQRLERVCESGSSLATALASGLAALVLDCVVLNDSSELEFFKGGKRSRAKTNMVHVFESINNQRYHNRDDDKYLRVWETFGLALRKSDADRLRFVVDGLMSRVRREAGQL